MKAATVPELTRLVHPHDLPRTEAALIQSTSQMSAAATEAIALDLLEMQDPNETLVRIVFRRWSDVDLAAATSFLQKLPNAVACIAAGAIAARLAWREAAAARNWAASLAQMIWREEPPLEMRPGVLNPFSGILRRHAGGGSPVQKIAWHTIIKTLCRRDPAVAVEAWWEANACGVGCRMLVPELVGSMAERPDLAVEFINQLGDGDLAVEALSSYVQNIAAHSPEQALKLIGKMERGEDRDQVIHSVLYAAPALVGRVQKLYSQANVDYESCRMKQSMVALGTREAVRQMLEFPELISWTRQAWDTFRDLLQDDGQEKEIRALLQEDLSPAILSGAASALATAKRTANAKESAELLRQFGPTDDGILGTVAGYLAEEEGMVAAAEFIISMPKKDGRFIWNKACCGGMRRDPAATIEWCREHWSSFPLKHALQDAMREWLRTDKTAAIAWSLDHSDTAWRDRLLRIIIEAEAHGHPQHCADLIANRLQEDHQAASDPLWIWLTSLVCTQWGAARQAEAAAWAVKLPVSPVRDAAEAVVRGERHCANYKLADED